ncbi:MAG: class I SAM-dependent methyltransferase [Candidatus Thorarchaeota archaeon]
MEEKELDQYRRGYEKAARYYNLFANNDDVPFYLLYAKKQGPPILDLAAGTGRISLELARSGFEVVALESSPAMIEEFRRQLEIHPDNVSNRITIVEGNMLDFNLSRTFPLVIIPSSFGHALTTDEQLALLRCVRNHLRDDGLFIVDLFPGGRQPLHGSFAENPVDLGDGTTVSRSGTIETNAITQILSLDLTFTIRDKATGRVLETISQKSGAALVFNREADLLMRAAKLNIVDEFGGFDRTPYTEDSGRRILVLSKD